MLAQVRRRARNLLRLEMLAEAFAKPPLRLWHTTGGERVGGRWYYFTKAYETVEDEADATSGDATAGFGDDDLDRTVLSAVMAIYGAPDARPHTSGLPKKRDAERATMRVQELMSGLRAADAAIAKAEDSLPANNNARAPAEGRGVVLGVITRLPATRERVTSGAAAPKSSDS